VFFEDDLVLAAELGQVAAAERGLRVGMQPVAGEHARDAAGATPGREAEPEGPVRRIPQALVEPAAFEGRRAAEQGRWDRQHVLHEERSHDFVRPGGRRRSRGTAGG
jgi:hypothetical protein